MKTLKKGILAFLAGLTMFGMLVVPQLSMAQTYPVAHDGSVQVEARLARFVCGGLKMNNGGDLSGIVPFCSLPFNVLNPGQSVSVQAKTADFVCAALKNSRDYDLSRIVPFCG